MSGHPSDIDGLSSAPTTASTKRESGASNISTPTTFSSNSSLNSSYPSDLSSFGSLSKSSSASSPSSLIDDISFLYSPSLGLDGMSVYSPPNTLNFPSSSSSVSSISTSGSAHLNNESTATMITLSGASLPKQNTGISTNNIKTNNGANTQSSVQHLPSLQSNAAPTASSSFPISFLPQSQSNFQQQSHHPYQSPQKPLQFFSSAQQPSPQTQSQQQQQQQQSFQQNPGFSYGQAQFLPLGSQNAFASASYPTPSSSSGHHHQQQQSQPFPSSSVGGSTFSSQLPADPASHQTTHEQIHQGKQTISTFHQISPHEFTSFQDPPTKRQKVENPTEISTSSLEGHSYSAKQINKECAISLTKKTLHDLNMLVTFLSTTNPSEFPNQSLINEAKEKLNFFLLSTSKSLATTLPTNKRIDLSNSHLSDFRLLDVLGTGTFGKVRLCIHAVSNSYCCMKILSKEKVVRLKQQEHVRNEKQILSSVKHPFIVELFATFQDDINLYFLMEYVTGGELFTAIKKSGGLSPAVARFYAAEMVLVIEYLHQRNVVHRDLKPENLLLDHTGHIKLTDFGFSKEVHDRTWTMCGTPEYIAPEVILSKGHGKGVDWWSLGVLIYEMIAGQPPFQGDNHITVFEKIISGKVNFPPYFDKDASDLISKLLHVDLTERLGCIRGGASNVKKHPWFSRIDWDGLLQKRTWGPIHPKVKADNMLANFEPVTAQSPTANYTGDQDLFKDF